HDQIQGAAPKVADKIEWGRRWPIGWTQGRQRASNRDVINVVSRSLGQRTPLTPARHPSIDQPRIALEHLLRTEPQPLHDTGPETLNQNVSAFAEVKTLYDGRLR